MRRGARTQDGEGGGADHADRGRRRISWPRVAPALAIIAALAALGWAMAPPATPSVTLAAAGSVDASEAEAVADDPEEVLRRFLRVTQEVYANAPEGADLGEVAELATGSALAEVESVVTELEVTDTRLEGTPRVVDLSTAAPQADGETTRVMIDACLDDARSVREDLTGLTTRVTDERDETRTLHHYGLIRQDGRWRVETHNFPDDPSC